MANEVDRRSFLRVAAPAVAMPMVAASAVARADLVTKEEIKAAYAVYDGMELRAATFNERFNLLIDMLFEEDPAVLRARLKVLHDEKANADYLVPSSGIVTDREGYKRITGHYPEDMARLSAENFK